MAQQQFKIMTAAELVNTRNAVGIISVFGAIILGISTAFIDDVTENIYIWFLALLIGLLFYVRAGGFIKNPNASILSGLRQIMYLFIVAWVSAIVVTLVIWDNLYTDSIIGIFIVLLGTYLMNHFISNGSILLNTSIINPIQAENTRTQATDRIGQLERLSELRDKGAISEDEYQKEKARVMQKYP